MQHLSFIREEASPYSDELDGSDGLVGNCRSTHD
jgi:hypothetical protein